MRWKKLGERERIWERWEEMVPARECDFGGRYGGEGMLGREVEGSCDWEGDVDVVLEVEEEVVGKEDWACE